MAKTLKHQFIDHYANMLYENQGGWAYEYIPVEACRIIAKKYFAENKPSKKDILSFLHD